MKATLRSLSGLACSVLLVTNLVSLASAERPRCYELLPSRTLAYLRIADVQELGEKFNETSLGRMIQQEQMKSLTKRLYEEAEVAFTPVAEEIGLTISQLLAIPQGEITIAAVAPSSGQEITAPVLMIDVEGQQPSMKKLVDLLERKLEEAGRTKTTKAERGTALYVFQGEDPRWTGVVHFQKDGLQVFTTNLDVAQQILAAWDGEESRATLEDNRDFANVMRHSKGPDDATPQIRWFVDPISLAKVSLRGNGAAQAGLAFLPVLGLDGLHALGGSLTMASDDFDMFTETHVITAEPRTGVLAAFAMQGGDPAPEPWVPHDAASYQTVYWNVQQTKDEVEKLFNSFRGENQFAEVALARASEGLGVDVQKDIIEVLDGRISLTTWISRPVTAQGMVYLAGVRLKPDHKFDKTLAAILEKVGHSLEKKTFGGSTYYFSPIEETEEPRPPRRLFLPAGQLAVGVVGDYVLISNQASAIERAIVTRSSKKSLANELDFKLVASKLRRQPGGKTPGYFAFERPEEGLRMMYELATAESTRDALANGAENNEFLRTLNSALNDNPLPSLAQLREFVAPNGAIITADDKGFHYTGLGLRRTPK